MAQQTSEKLIRAALTDSWIRTERECPSLKIRVQYFASVRELVGLREEILDVEEKATVLDVLRVLARRHGEEFREYVFNPGTESPRSHLQFLVNEDSISSLNGLSTVLPDNSSLAIFPPVAGG